MAEGTAVAPTSTSTQQAPANQPAIAKKTADAATTPGSGTPEKPANPYAGTKHKVTIDGVSQEVDYDDLVRDYQKGTASDKRFKEAQAIQQATSELMQGLSRGDEKAWGWFKGQVPKDVFKKVAFDYAYQEMEYDSLPPDKKREMELDNREKTLKEKEEEREKTIAAKQWQSDVQSAGENIQKQLDEFVEKSGQQPSSEQLYRMSEYMLAYLHKNNALPSVDTLYQYTEKQLELDAQSVLKKKSSNINELKKFLGPEAFKALKKAIVEESEGMQPRRGGSSEQRPVPHRGEPKKVGIDDAFALLEKRIKQRR